MKLEKPFEGDFPMTQHFGDNLNVYYKQEGLLGHQGIDFAMPNGTPIFSAVNGVVVAVSREMQKGEGVAVMSSDQFEYNGQPCLLDTIYWHLKDGSILVNVGDKIKTGQRLGLSNNTGQSTGPHLHFSIIPMATDGSRRSLAGLNNGYKGCIDPMPYLNLVPVPRTLKRGMSGEDVRQLQVKLHVKPTTGFFWDLTLKAVKEFQQANGLVPDGVVGSMTRAKLNL